MSWTRRGERDGTTIYAAVAGPRDSEDPDARYLMSVAAKRGDAWRVTTDEIALERVIRSNVEGRLDREIDRRASRLLKAFDDPRTSAASADLIRELSAL